MRSFARTPKIICYRIAYQKIVIKYLQKKPYYLKLIAIDIHNSSALQVA